MRPGLAAVLLVAGLASACSAGGGSREPDPAPPPTSSAPTGVVVAAGPALLPDPAAVVAAAGAPDGWVRGRERVLMTYSVPRAEVRDTGARQAVVLVSRGGEVLGRWASDRPSWRWLEWRPAGGGFVGTSPYGRTRLLVGPGGMTGLSLEQGSRPYRHGDVRFGEGWLLDRAGRTLARERLPRDRCRGGVEVDLRSRTWCLDEDKQVVSWTDDHEAWTSHALSTSHFQWCDGGDTGADLQVLGEQVVVGLYRADFTHDRGLSWHDVDLPFEMVGAHQGQGSSFPNCTTVTPLRDGRLVLSYFGTAVATDASNTTYALADFDQRYRVRNLAEGVLAGVRRGTREPFASYDGGTTWVPLRVPELLDTLFDDQGA